MEIPKYESWFTTTFGQEKGGSWARAYGKELEKDQKDFEDLLLQLSQMEGRFSIHQIDTANRYDTLDGQLDEYLADWIKSTPRGEEMVHIADFFFIDGKFRWDSAVPVRTKSIANVSTTYDRCLQSLHQSKRKGPCRSIRSVSAPP